jgi:hypothetical protein
VAVSVSRLLNQVAGNRRHTVTAVTMDSSYAAGGEPLTANDLGLSTVEAAQVEPTGGYVGRYIISTALLEARWTGTATASILVEPSATTNLSTITFNVDAWGI